ncbi:MAG: hypothetical protein CMK59_10220 [Proteobacteria bacterium]|nr:hypothetical protein [Pseudomonadota bacterium]
MFVLNILMYSCSSSSVEDSSVEPSSFLVLKDEHNFEAISQIDLDTQPLTAGSDAWLSWSDVSQDLIGHPFNAEEVDQVTLVVFGNIDKDALEDSIASNDMTQSNVRLLVNCTPQETGCWLSDFTMLGTDIDVEDRFQPDEGLWLIALSSSLSEITYKRLMLIEPVVDSVNQEASFEDSRGLFNVDANLTDIIPIQAPSLAPVTFDWSGLTKDGQGNEMPLHRIDRLDIAEYKNLSVSDLEEDFLDIEILSDNTWTLDVSGLTQISTDSMDGFNGFTQDSTWIVALRCMNCGTPMPYFLGRINVP